MLLPILPQSQKLQGQIEMHHEDMLSKKKPPIFYNELGKGRAMLQALKKKNIAQNHCGKKNGAKSHTWKQHKEILMCVVLLRKYTNIGRKSVIHSGSATRDMRLLAIRDYLQKVVQGFFEPDEVTCVMPEKNY